MREGGRGRGEDGRECREFGLAPALPSPTSRALPPPPNPPRHSAAGPHCPPRWRWRRRRRRRRGQGPARGGGCAPARAAGPRRRLGPAPSRLGPGPRRRRCLARRRLLGRVGPARPGRVQGPGLADSRLAPPRRGRSGATGQNEAIRDGSRGPASCSRWRTSSRPPPPATAPHPPARLPLRGRGLGSLSCQWAVEPGRRCHRRIRPRPGHRPAGNRRRGLGRGRKGK